MDSESNKIEELKKTDTKRIRETIPAINLLKGKPVIKGKGGYEPLRDKEGNIVEVNELIDRLKDRFSIMFITDINGINRDRPQLELYKEISSKIKLWIDAGPRTKDGTIDILVAGAEKVVFGTKTLIGMEELKRALELSENIILSIDYDNGIVSPKKNIRDMSPSHLVDEAKKVGINDVIFTDLRHLTSDAYFSMDVGKTLLRNGMNIYFHGRFDEDTKSLDNMNLAGTIIEMEKLL